MFHCFFFFFSSRRRHTRLQGDWSSDVCSSDLELAAPLVAWSTFLYAVLLLVIVLAMPGGIAELLDFKSRRPLQSNRAIVPRPELLGELLGEKRNPGTLTLEGVALSFGGVRAIDGLDLTIR